MRMENRKDRERTSSRPISELLSKMSQITDLCYDDLWSYGRCRISFSDTNRVHGPTEVFLCLEKLQVVLSSRGSKNAKDESEGNVHAMALLLRNLKVLLGAYPTS